MNITVSGPKDDVQAGTLSLSVSSLAPILNPPVWKDLWKLSPLSTVDGGIAVPGLVGVRSMTMENAWQFLKVWPPEGIWQKDAAMEAFRSTCAIRYPRGRGKKPVGHYWGLAGRLLPYIEARQRIYAPAYRELLQLPDRKALIERLREAAMTQPVCVHDPDSYDVARCGMSDIAQAIDYEPRPFAHAFVVALAVQGRVDALL